jgi:hypothetical protein
MVEYQTASKKSPLVYGGDISRHAGESHLTQRDLNVFILGYLIESNDLGQIF